MIARFNGIDYIPFSPVPPKAFYVTGNKVQPLLIVFVIPMFSYKQLDKAIQDAKALLANHPDSEEE